MFPLTEQGESETYRKTHGGKYKRELEMAVAYRYTKDERSKIVIHEEEAKIVRRIFNEYLSGRGSYVIDRDLNEDLIPTVRRTEYWDEGVVKVILQNAIYEGNLLSPKNIKNCGAPVHA